MDLNKEFGFDADLAESGVWVSVDGNGTRLKVAAMPNPAYDRFIDSFRSRSRFLGNKEIPETVYEEALAKHVLLGWEGVEDQGMAIDATEKNRLAMLRKYRNFKALVMREALDLANFQREADEIEIKN